MATNNFSYSLIESILYSPASIVPSLSDKEILTVTISSIQAYIEQKIDFQTLADVASNIKLFSGMRKDSNQDLISNLNKSLSLSNDGKTAQFTAYLNTLLNKLVSH